MKGLILCGGRGTRLKPITDSIPKQLIPVANIPLIFYTIDLLLKSGIKEIGIVVNEENSQIFKQSLKDKFNIDFHYIIQANPKGIAHIEGDKVINLEKKPEVAYSNLAITGIYAFDNNIFIACRNIQLSSRGEYEITDEIKWLLNNEYNINYEILSGYWRDVGSHRDVIEENINRLKSMENDIKGHIEDSSISGNVILEKGAAIYGSVIKGPIIIEKDSIIKNSYIGPYTSIGKGVNIEETNIECSIILDDCFISSMETTIDFSIVGEGSIITEEKGIKKSNRFITGKNSMIYLKRGVEYCE